MFCIIDTEDKLKALNEYLQEDCFIDGENYSEDPHPRAGVLSFVYYHPFNLNHGFILPVSTASTDISRANLLIFFSNLKGKIWTLDKKNLMYKLSNHHRQIHCVKTAYHLSNLPIPDEESFDTVNHIMFKRRPDFITKKFYNYYISLTKQYEKWENIFKSLRFDLQPDGQGFYENNVIPVFHLLEYRLLPSSIEEIRNRFPASYSSHNHGLGCRYYLRNNTARPSCAFDGINFMALNKDDGTRKIIEASSSFHLVEFDYRGYQIKLLADLLNYPLTGDIHRELAKIYFHTEAVTQEQIEEGKKMTFRYAYGRDEVPPNIEFFKLVYKRRDELWKQVQELGYIVSPISGRKIYNIEKITQVLPYLMQCLETERNVLVLTKVQEFLQKTLSRIILYSYDAFLFEIQNDGGLPITMRIKEILEEGDYQTKMKFGFNYHEMNIPLIC